MHVDHGLDMKEFDNVQRLRREVLAECVAVNSKVANKVFADLCDKVDFMVEDWDECVEVVVKHTDRDEPLPVNEDHVSLEEFVYEKCDEPRLKCLRPLPFKYEDLVKQVFKAVGEYRYTSLSFKRLLERLTP